MSRRSVCKFVTVLFFLSFPLLLLAAPTISISPSSVDWNYTGTIQVSITGLTGTSAYLKAYVDVDEDGVLDPEDYLAWCDVARDNVTEWSPNMVSDTNPNAGSITLYVPPTISSFHFPHTAGIYILQAEDSNGGALSPASSFTITQTSETQTVSGTVRDTTGTPIGGAVVVLFPLNIGGPNGPQEDWERQGPSCISASDGTYTLNVPSSMISPAGCARRMVMAVKPGYVTPFFFADAANPNQPVIEMTGSGPLPGNDPVIRAGTATVTGQVKYSSGNKLGQGIPGAFVFAWDDSGPAEYSVAMTDENGNYSFSLSYNSSASGEFQLGCFEGTNVSLQGAVMVKDYSITVDVSGGGPVSAPDLLYPAADAFITGTLYDNTSTHVGAGYLVHSLESQYTGDCHVSNSYTKTDGTFTLGVIGSATNYHAVLVNRAYIPDDNVSVGRTCAQVPSGQTLTGQDLYFQTPASHLTGTVTDLDGNPLSDIVIQGLTYPSCQMVCSRAVSGCDGTYSLPVVNGDWSVGYQGTEPMGYYLNIDSNDSSRSVTVSNGNQSGIDFIMGPWNIDPVLTSVTTDTGPAGTQVKLTGICFSMGSTPLVYFDSTPATVLAYRADTGWLYAVVPSLATGEHTVRVFNPDIGKYSNALCFNVTAGTFSSACSISGTTYDPSLTAIDGALVEVRDGSTGDFKRMAISSGGGSWSAGLADTGSYKVRFIPPQGVAWAWYGYTGVSCAGTQNHQFANANTVTGVVHDENGDGIWNCVIKASTGERAVSNQDGSFTLYLASGSCTIYPLGPPESRYMNDQSWTGTISSDTNLGTFTLSKGYYFSGYLKDKSGYGLGLASLGAVNGGSVRGRTRSFTCSGKYIIAVPSGVDLTLYITPNGASSSTEVHTVNIGGDTSSEFNFKVFDSSSEQFTDSAPHIETDYDTHAQVGQPVHIFANNITGSSRDVLFSDGSGGTIAGTNTIWDDDRGLILTTVPPGAASGGMIVRVDGNDSLPAAFNVNSGTFSPTITVSGTITSGGSPVENTAVLLFRSPSGNGYCEGAGAPDGYALTDSSGNYSISCETGDISLLFIPPFSSTLAATAAQLPGTTGSTVLDQPLSVGVQSTLKVLDSTTLNPVKNARMDTETFSGTNDFTLTDSSGDATLFLPPGDTDISIAGPAGSRYIESRMQRTIPSTGPYSIGTTTLTAGVFVEGRAQKTDKSPVSGAEFDTEDTINYDEMGWAMADSNGVGCVPTSKNNDFYLAIESGSDSVVDYSSGTMSAQTNDLIIYPSITLQEAGIVTGTVEDSSSSPLEGIYVNAIPEGWGNGDGWAKTCSDGIYRMKVPAGNHYIGFNMSGNGPQDPSYLDEFYDGALCSDNATLVYVPAGGTVSGIDATLTDAATITGTVTVAGSPFEGATVCAQGVGLPAGCNRCTVTDSIGNYTLYVPASSGYMVSAHVDGYPDQCYNHNNGCTRYDAVTAPASTIDFDLGNVPDQPGLCSSGNPLEISYNSSTGDVTLTFESIADATAYSLYQGNIGTYYDSNESCFLNPLTDNGNGTYSYTYTPPSGDIWFLISASNSEGESALTESPCNVYIDPQDITRCGAH